MIRFSIRGDLRFLSHAETMRVFQRACVRAGVKLIHSQGYNPHPRMSLVLPRSVGVESDDEMLCLRLEAGQNGPDVGGMKEKLGGELPEGIEIHSVDVSEAKRIPEAVSVRYLLSIRGRPKGIDKRVEQLLDTDEIIVQRRTGDAAKAKSVDVRPFIKSIKTSDEGIIVEAGVSRSGTIRVDEIFMLLGLGVEDLAEPVRRTMVEWKNIERAGRN